MRHENAEVQRIVEALHSALSTLNTNTIRYHVRVVGNLARITVVIGEREQSLTMDLECAKQYVNNDDYMTSLVGAFVVQWTTRFALPVDDHRILYVAEPRPEEAQHIAQR